MVSDFVFWKMAYDNGWATEQDIQDAILFELITQEQGDLILASKAE